MKRFYNAVQVEQEGDCWQVTLDGRPIRTQGGARQIVPSRELAERMAREWRDQGEEIDPGSFTFRDLADFAIDHVRPDRAAFAAALLPYAETDTLCYRADPDEPLHARQQALWEPLLTRAEERHGIRLYRISGIIHRPQPPESMERLGAILAAQDEFTLAGLQTLSSLAASLTIALEAIEPDADLEGLFAAANCEQDWQADLWGWDHEAEQSRAARLEAFSRTAGFVQLARSGAGQLRK